eukprot:12401795-Karenia_brevis.AAC.1
MGDHTDRQFSSVRDSTCRGACRPRARNILASPAVGDHTAKAPLTRDSTWQGRMPAPFQRSPDIAV